MADQKAKTKGQQTRARIVAEAAAIFNQHGYAGSSLTELMKATGLEKGGIYRHFSSKEQLAVEAFDYAWAEARRVRHPDPNVKADAVGWLKQLIANFVDRRSPVAGGCPILNTAIEADDGNPILRARVSAALRVWIAQIQAIVAGAVARGELRAGVDPKSVATLIVATLEGALMMSRLERSDDALRRVQEHLNEYLDTKVAVVKTRS